MSYLRTVVVFAALALQVACTIWLAVIFVSGTPKLAADLVTRGLIAEEAVRTELGDRYTSDRFENMRQLLGLPKADRAFNAMLGSSVLIAGLWIQREFSLRRRSDRAKPAAEDQASL